MNEDQAMDGTTPTPSEWADLVVNYLPRIRSQVRRIVTRVPYGFGELEDVEQAVCLWLLEKYAPSYDPRRASPNTYIHNGIRFAVHNVVNRCGTIPAGQIERMRRIAKAIDYLKDRGVDPTNEAIADVTGLSVKSVIGTRRRGMPSYHSVETALTGRQCPIGELLESPAVDLDWLHDMAAMYHQVERLLEQIPEREAYIIRQCEMHGRTKADIGIELNLCRERVRQLHGRGLERLRALAARHELWRAA